MIHPRAQTDRENCTWHNFNVVPTKAGYYATVGSYQSGISILEFTDPAAPREIAFADPAPLQNPPPAAPTTGIILGGDWSTYWHNGTIFESDIKRGVTTWRLNLAGDPTMTQANSHLSHINTFALSNPQTQAGSFAPENVKPTVTVRTPVAGQGAKLGSAVVADFDCADDVAVESCVGTVADGANVDTASLGNKVFRVTATDTAGNLTVTEVPFMVNSVDYSIPAGTGTVVTTLGLAMGTAPAQFGAFTPGVAQEYLATAAPRITLDGRQRDADRVRPGDDVRRPPGQRYVRADEPGPGVLDRRQQRDGTRRRAGDRSRGSGPGRELGRSGDQCRGESDLPSEHHRHGDPPPGHVQQDADVHAQHDRSVSPSSARRLGGAHFLGTPNNALAPSLCDGARR